MKPETLLELERDALLRERDLLLADREALVCERDRLREERDDAERRWGNLLRDDENLTTRLGFGRAQKTIDALRARNEKLEAVLVETKRKHAAPHRPGWHCALCDAIAAAEEKP